MKGGLQLESYLHRYAFQRYCLGEALHHPLTERHSDVVLGCAWQLLERSRKLQAADHLGTRHLHSAPYIHRSWLEVGHRIVPRWLTRMS